MRTDRIGKGRKAGGRTRPRGFTLIEVLIVIAIILALIGLVSVALFQRRDEAKRDTAKIDLATIEQALKLFRMDFDRWPSDEEGIVVLWDKSALVAETEEEETKWKKTLDKPMPKDRWGQEWGYRQVSEHGDESMYDLWSFGPDKEEGTEDDITSWTEEDETGVTGTTESPRTGG